MPDPEAMAEPDGAAVAAVLERLRAGVRQRQAELACLDTGPAALAAARRDAVIEEPSFRVEGIGAVRAFVERASYVLFARRQHRALLRQQNRFNRSAVLALEELHDRQQSLALELGRLTSRLEAAAGAGAGSESAPADPAPLAVGGTAGRPGPSGTS